MDSLESYILPFCTIVLVLGALVVAFDCLWRTERALSGLVRLMIFLMATILSKAVVLVLNILPTDKYALFAEIIDLLSGLLLLISALLLFRIIRSLHRQRP